MKHANLDLIKPKNENRIINSGYPKNTTHGYEYTSDCFSSQLAMNNLFVKTEDSNMGHLLLLGQICINGPLNPLRFVLKDLKESNTAYGFVTVLRCLLVW